MATIQNLQSHTGKLHLNPNFSACPRLWQAILVTEVSVVVVAVLAPGEWVVLAVLEGELEVQENLDNLHCCYKILNNLCCTNHQIPH